MKSHLKDSEALSGNGRQSVAVVIPCYGVRNHILGVISAIGPEVQAIYVVDDACFEQTGRYVSEKCHDSRIRVLFNRENRGVGGATIAGYRQAISDGADIIVKLDGDGQMDPKHIPILISPIVNGVADYTKGNRFYYLEGVQQMPLVRLLGNAALSFIAKFSSGYWDIFDPTNGFTAVHSKVVEHLPLEKIDNRYFFESDMLFRLNIIRAVVMDVPLPARYADEKSNLKVFRSIPEFACKHMRNTLKRIFYNYYLRDFSAMSLGLLLGLLALSIGMVVGSTAWVTSVRTGVVATSGTVMLAALPTLVGIQLILSFLATDSANVPKIPLQKRL
ncbi:undecaprenyl-phosphate glycosyltransferase, DPM/DPG-synthase-like family [Geotalea daltonii FRC-32]|uniref:Undecaprenyl-phosphate glycosyltransferase, DPM/DPG-synthase-like family n=1 Tax=Geotalea daltonii (strain DSM 22248 / JCM 15807 / FRC-32) TaxID=316067 RepID=B9M3U0_GEODF|nr:glycosyltransferase family 2 protein [Geotalea daltonii]ACM19583.1 undecaprenyl-phosphate glycosyltransferase, DPM/DPG-synthase-like family [Geotalea daltonii FRC-32]